jgi:hypothetical protein
MSNITKKLIEAYLEISEKKKLDPVDAKALKGKHDDREDGDIDNDGDEDESDEYLHNRRKAVKKAMDEGKEECPKCEGEGCDHCDDKGYHEVDEAIKLRGFGPDHKKAAGSALKKISSMKADEDERKKAVKAYKDIKGGKYKGVKFANEEVELVEQRPNSENEAIEIIASSIAMQVGAVKAALKTANLDPLSVVTALKGKKTIKAMQLGNLVMGHAFGGSISKKDLAPIAKAASSAFKNSRKNVKEAVELDEMTSAQKAKFDKLYKKMLNGPEHKKIMSKADNKIKGDDQFHALVKKMAMEEVSEAMTISRKMATRALASVKAQPKDKVSLKKAPWDKDKKSTNEEEVVMNPKQKKNEKGNDTMANEEVELPTIYSRILEARKRPEGEKAGETAAKGEMDFVKNHTDNIKVNDDDEKGHDDASKAGRASPNAKARSGDNMKGDKKVIPSATKMKG